MRFQSRVILDTGLEFIILYITQNLVSKTRAFRGIVGQSAESEDVASRSKASASAFSSRVSNEGA